MLIVMAGPCADLAGGDMRALDVKKKKSSRLRKDTSQIELIALPLLTEVDSSELEELLVKKMRNCCVIYDFTEPPISTAGIEDKSTLLNELLDFISTDKWIFSKRVYEQLFVMFSANLFRDLPPKESDGFYQEDDDVYLDPSWPHLELVYRLLLKVVETSDFQTAPSKNVIDLRFLVHKLFELLNSEDPRERDSLKTILHRIYGKCLWLRSHIRKKISYTLLTFAFEAENYSGVGELLEICGSIICGFARPLKPDHKQFLLKVLIPLHKANSLQTFHGQLSYCIVQFLERDPTLTDLVIHGLLKYWPKTSSQKEVLFLREIEEILDRIEPEDFYRILRPLFGQIVKSISSLHFQVVEKALQLWNNEYIVSLIEENHKIIMPMVIPVLHNLTQVHWNGMIVSLAWNTLSLSNTNKKVEQLISSTAKKKENRN